jgi:hypothetical protein
VCVCVCVCVCVSVFVTCMSELGEQARRKINTLVTGVGVNIQPFPNNLWLWGSQTTS